MVTAMLSDRIKNTFSHWFSRLHGGVTARYLACWSVIKDRLKSGPFYPHLRRLKLGWNRLKSLAACGPFVHALRPLPGARPATGENPLEIVMLVVSDLRIDPRVLREAQALARSGYHVKVIVPDTSKPPLTEAPLDWGPGIEFIPLHWAAASYIMSYPYLLGRMMLDRALQERPFAFHCHDLTTAIIGLAAARKVGSRCVCDFHEWWSENVTYDWDIKRYVPHSEKERLHFRRAENLVMSRADAVITVCDSIADELSREFTDGQRQVHVVRNIPPIEPVNIEEAVSLRTELGIPDGQMLLLWQGGTGYGRNIEPIIEALAYAPDVTFVIRGPSLDMFGDGYRTLADRISAKDRLILLGPVASSEVVRGAIGADVGIWSLETLCKNFTYALPNKVFEYLAAGVPVVGANYPEVKKLLEGAGVGICFDPNSPESIGKALKTLSANPGLRQEMCNRIPDLLGSIRAEKEWLKIVDIYDGLAAGRKL
jgi:glycosyltransferase involved in cell wall biosynthesis